MISDGQAREIALFFLFSLLDEKHALQAAHKAIASLKSGGDSELEAGELPRSTIVKHLRKTFEVQRKQMPRNRAIEVPEDSWTLPDGVDLGAWAKFHKDSSDGEIVALVLGKILKYGEESVAEGLNISIGTLKYRIGKGMRQLGRAGR